MILEVYGTSIAASLHIYMHAGTVNKAGDTPLSLACANGHLDTVKYLVNQLHCDPRSKYVHFQLQRHEHACTIHSI